MQPFIKIYILENVKSVILKQEIICSYFITIHIHEYSLLFIFIAQTYIKLKLIN